MLRLLSIAVLIYALIQLAIAKRILDDVTSDHPVQRTDPPEEE